MEILLGVNVDQERSITRLFAQLRQIKTNGVSLMAERGKKCIWEENVFEGEANHSEGDGKRDVKVNSNSEIYKIGNVGLYLNEETGNELDRSLERFMLVSGDEVSRVATKKGKHRLLRLIQSFGSEVKGVISKASFKAIVNSFSCVKKGSYFCMKIRTTLFHTRRITFF